MASSDFGAREIKDAIIAGRAFSAGNAWSSGTTTRLRRPNVANCSLARVVKLMSKIALKSVVPILFVQDVSASAAFFQEKLRFEIDFLHGAPPFYGSVSRDKVCLHLRCVQQPNFVELAAREVSLILATVEVSDVQGLFAEFQERGVEFTQTPAKQPWGGTDFHVRDPDGNVISFVTYE
jgi:uncharacterized glyoxalase superfamily protein PhnB